MSGFRTAQANFCRGELGPQLYGRFDVDAWGTALRRARNVIVLKYGGLSKRPGTQLVAEVLDASQPVRLVPFQFSLDQTYALEMGQGYLSPCAMGGRLLEEELAITAISNEEQALVAMDWHGLAVGDLLYVTGCEGEIGALLNGRAWPVRAVVDANHLRIAADTRDLAPFTACAGGSTRTAPPVAAPPPSVPPVTAAPTPPVIYYGGSGRFGRGELN
ncbi:hypothetical protein [Novosphingobium pituita]|uniref:Uncharacterized protein n=1 Tax=Novosphingobium pituita TaxID=3056842 RepID=A0ABQ6P8X6_9SPHN|nr:hypothetical protein [Novosphingobium sp. IK01]GMM61678.1 hypothetical protein NUTIK01_24550 [Novosphingobium sp. IK01]